MAVIDAFSYNGERDILNIRLNILDKHTDRFVIVEAGTTFSGNKKPLYFKRHEKYFKKWSKKITYHVIDENYLKEEIALAESSPNTKGAAHWKNEFLQKESIHKALKGLKNDDIVYIGDVDEIWTPYKSNWIPFDPAKLRLLVYAYYLNNLSNEEFWGTLVARYGDIKDVCLNHLRSNIRTATPRYYGWHFTSMGGVEEVRRKLNDSYTAESYNTPQVQERLQERVGKGMDYLGRSFTFKTDESNWPDYLKENKRKYIHLCK